MLEMQAEHLLQLLGIGCGIPSRVVVKDDADFIYPAFQFLDGLFEFFQLVFAVTIECPLLAPLPAGISPADRIASVKPEQDQVLVGGGYNKGNGSHSRLRLVCRDQGEMLLLAESDERLPVGGLVPALVAELDCNRQVGQLLAQKGQVVDILSFSVEKGRKLEEGGCQLVLFS